MFDYAVTVRSLLLLLGLVATYGFAQSPNPARGVKPLFRDPVYDGAADPVVVWNPHVKRWWMFYTNRRANAPGLSGVAWVHGTRIGIAESADLGATWSYAGTADIELPPDIRGAEPTHWAPDVFTAPMAPTTCSSPWCRASSRTGSIRARSSTSRALTFGAGAARVRCRWLRIV